MQVQFKPVRYEERPEAAAGLAGDAAAHGASRQRTPHLTPSVSETGLSERGEGGTLPPAELHLTVD